MTNLGLLAIYELERVENAWYVDVSEDLRPQVLSSMSVYSMFYLRIFYHLCIPSSNPGTRSHRCFTTASGPPST